MTVTLDKFDLDSVSEYLYRLMQHINEKSEGDIKMVFIVASDKAEETNHILPKGTASEAASLLVRALDNLTKEYPEIGMRIEKVQL